MTKPTPERGTHFWFASFRTTSDAISFAGTSTPAPGATRMDLYNDITEKIRRENPHLAGMAVIAFDIQPNQL